MSHSQRVEEKRPNDNDNLLIGAKDQVDVVGGDKIDIGELTMSFLDAQAILGFRSPHETAAALSLVSRSHLPPQQQQVLLKSLKSFEGPRKRPSLSN